MAEIKDLMENKEFTDKLAGLTTTDEFIQAFADNGVIVTEKDLDEVFATAQATGEELNEEDLSNVSGGSLGTGLIVAGITWWAVRKGRR